MKMDDLDREDNVKKKTNEIKTYAVSAPLRDIKEVMSINTNTFTKYSEQKLFNKAFNFHSQGNISEAEKYYQYSIEKGFNDPRVYSNYGIILKKQGKLDQAEKYFLKAIEIKPDYAIAYYNLANTLRTLGRLNEAVLSMKTSIKFNSDYYLSHYNLSGILNDLAKFKEAEKYLLNTIKIKPDFEIAYNNLGDILIKLGRIKEAENNLLKAIEIKPSYSIAYFNLGNLYRKNGKLREAKTFFIKAIKINPYLSKSYFLLSTFKNFNHKDEIWINRIFSENIISHSDQESRIDIYFARANILHRRKNFKESKKYLELANQIKLDIKPSKADLLIDKSKNLFIESSKKNNNKKDEIINDAINVFIVGMPRSGSTLLDSIISLNEDSQSLGEVNILEESFLDRMRFKDKNNEETLLSLYSKKLKELNINSNIVINKWLYNYQYTGVIAEHIFNSKIIHCFRHPLDNILSIYRSNFINSNEYTSSLIDCAKVYLDHEEIMSAYKSKYCNKIYDFNYDSLVINSKNEIRSLISWLNWDWDNKYLFPHLNNRLVSTASSIQVRSPINSKSVGGWKNYRDMLQPAIDFLQKHEKYKNIDFS